MALPTLAMTLPQEYDELLAQAARLVMHGRFSIPCNRTEENWGALRASERHEFTHTAKAIIQLTWASLPTDQEQD